MPRPQVKTKRKAGPNARWCFRGGRNPLLYVLWLPAFIQVKGAACRKSSLCREGGVLLKPGIRSKTGRPQS